MQRIIRGAAIGTRLLCSKMDAKRKKVQSFQGPISAVFTPFNKNGSLNLDAIGPYATYLHENDVNGIFVTGTTGEFLSLTCNERKEMLEKWLKEAKNRIDLIIVQVGTGCMNETKELAKHANEKGVDCIAVLPPLYYKPNNNNELISYLSEISAAAPDTPLLYYHIPIMSGTQVQLTDLLPEIIKSVPNFVGAKYSSNDLRDAALCRAKYKDQFKIILGADELQLNGLASGLNSAILISSNPFPSLSTAIHKAFQEKDIERAMANQNKLIIVMDTVLKHGAVLQSLKAAMNLLSPVDVGPTRHPLLPLTDVAKKELQTDLSRINFNAE